MKIFPKLYVQVSMFPFQGYTDVVRSDIIPIAVINYFRTCVCILVFGQEPIDSYRPVKRVKPA